MMPSWRNKQTSSSEADQATVVVTITRNMYVLKIPLSWTCVSISERIHTQTYRSTHRHADRNTLHFPGGEVNATEKSAMSPVGVDMRRPVPTGVLPISDVRRCRRPAELTSF